MVRPEQPGSEDEERRLPGTVRSDQPDDARRRDDEVHLAHRHQATEVPREAPHLENGSGDRARPRRSGLTSMMITSPSPKKNQRHSVRSTLARVAMPSDRPTQRTRNVIWASRIRSKSVISMPPRITPLRLPIPPSTTMHRSMIETLNSKAPGVMACSFAA